MATGLFGSGEGGWLRSLWRRAAGPHDLTNGAIAPTLLLFSLPVLGANVLQSINGSISAMWVGRLIGEVGLAATSNVHLIMFMVFAMVFGFGAATTIMVGQCMGRGDIQGARRSVGSGISLFFLLGLIVAISGWIGAPAILRVLATPVEVQVPALNYLRLMFLGLPMSLISVFLAMALRGTGDSATPLLLLLPGMVIDILLSPLLILGFGPVPPLGVLGAGFANLVASMVSLSLLFATIYGRDLPIRLRGEELRYLLPTLSLIRTIARKGFPIGLQMLVTSGSALILLGLVNREGTSTVAAYGAVNQLWTYVQMPAIAVGLAVSSMAAQNVGAGRWDRVEKIAMTGICMNLALTGGLVALILLFAHQVLTLFLPGSARALPIAEHINWIAAWSFILQGASIVLTSVTRANGATLAPLIIMFAAFVPGRLGFAYGTRELLGPDAIWWSFPVGAALSLAFCYAYYQRGKWRQEPLLMQPSGKA